jgi:hypothetical protein
VSSNGGFVAVLVIDLHFAQAGSLKHKRKELSSIKAILHGRLGAAVTAALTGASPAALAQAVDRVQRWLEGRVPDGVRIERIVASVEELRP